MLRRTSLLGALVAIVAFVVTPSSVIATEAAATATFANTTSATTRTLTGEASSHVQWSIRSGQTKSRGVNLGSWLVVEYWMTGNADFWLGLGFANAFSGEYYAITKAANPDVARAQLQKHHDTFITEADIKAISEAGINTVRVPVGYWIVGFDNDDPSGLKEWDVYTKGTLKYLDVLVKQWAVKYNVAVLVDIHAAKGSQNGQDHSSPSVIGMSYWAGYKENVDQTIHLVTFLADRYKNDEAFLGIGLLNEPQSATNKQVLYGYYEAAYKAIRGSGNDCVIGIAPVLSEQGPDAMVGFMQAPQYTNVWVEWHPYFLWGYEQTSESDIINLAVKRDFQAKVAAWNGRAGHNRLLFSEWSLGTGDKFTTNVAGRYEFAQAQMNVLNQAEGGWTFWSWKTSSDDGAFYGWSLRNALRDEKIRSIIIGA